MATNFLHRASLSHLCNIAANCSGTQITSISSQSICAADVDDGDDDDDDDDVNDDDESNIDNKSEGSIVIAFPCFSMLANY